MKNILLILLGVICFTSFKSTQVGTIEENETAAIIFTEGNATSDDLIQGPYGGTARSIPGTIQGEDYDVGGEGVSYHDIEETNLGGGYRTGSNEGVDINSKVQDDDESYTIGYFKDGEWMEYTVNVEEGVYDISIRYGSKVGGQQLKVYMDNSLLTTFDTPITGGYSTYVTATNSGISITGGVGRILKLENVNGDFNLNWIQFVKITTAIPSFEESGAGHVVYPIPFNDILCVGNMENVTRIELINMSGETLIVKQNPKATEMKIDTKSLKNGVYILRLLDSTGAVSVHKVVK